MSWIGDVKEAELLKDEQLINLHKRYVMSQTDRTVSMQYRQNDARDRLEKRLKNVKTNGDEDDESTAGTRPVSRVGKELAKRLASNSARRRMSLLASESEAKERLQQRLMMKSSKRMIPDEN
jgi:hypothetical protein